MSEKIEKIEVFWTKIHSEEELLKYGEADAVLSELCRILYSIMPDKNICFMSDMKNGNYLIRGWGRYNQYESFKRIVSQKYPGLCEFNVRVDK